MFEYLRRSAGPALALIAVGGLWAPRVEAQSVLSSEITVSGSEATIDVEIAGGSDLTVTLENGRVLLNGSEAGRYPAGSPLEASWRALLGRAIATEPEGLGELLLAWEPPTGLSGDASASASALRNRLSSTLTGSGTSLNVQAPAGGTGVGSLAQSAERLRQLASVVEELGNSGPMQVRVNETVRVPAGETIEGSLVVVDGDLAVDGTVDGDVVVLGGRVELGAGSRITGALRWSDATIVGDAGRVSANVEELRIPVTPSAPFGLEPPERPSLPSRDFGNDRELDIREEIRRGVIEATREAGNSRGSFSPLRDIGDGIAGLFQTFISFGILFAVGLGLLYFFPRHTEVVARTARTRPGRSALVGAAALILAVPAWVVGAVLLAVSIVGIPGLLIWIPGVPVALAASIVLGYMAVARNLGQWVSGREIGGLARLDQTRPAVHVGVGLVLLLGAYAVAHVFEMAGWLGFFEVLFLIAAIAITALTVFVGVGAVVLSRAGRDPLYAGPGWGPIGDEGLEESGDPLP